MAGTGRRFLYAAAMFEASLYPIGMLAGFAASGLAFFTGFIWRDVAKGAGITSALRLAAQLTGAVLILAGIAGFVLLGLALG